MSAGSSQGAAAAAEPPGAAVPEGLEAGGAAGAREAAAGTLRLSIERAAGATIGMNLDVTDLVSLVVVDILPGSIREWNEAQPRPGQQLRVNDRIVEANGASEDAQKMLCVLKDSTMWQLVVQRPAEYRAVIERHGVLSLGLDLRYALTGTSLMIADIGDGPIKDWNARSSTRKVKKFDRIIELNGVRGSAQQLLRAGKGQETLDMCILQYD